MPILIEEGRIVVTSDFQDVGTLEIRTQGENVVIECTHETGEGWDAGIDSSCSRADFVAALATIGILEVPA